MAPDPRLDAIKKLAEGLTDLCPEHLRQSVRHVQRNCDIDCSTHEDDATWDDCKQPGRYDGERMAKALASIPFLLSVVEAQAVQIAKVRELHKVETRWTHPEVHGSLDTREEAAEYDYAEAMGDPEKSLVDSFEVCAECGRIEGEQLRDVGEIWDFRESIWPCPTSAALAPEGPEA